MTNVKTIEGLANTTAEKIVKMSTAGETNEEISRKTRVKLEKVEKVLMINKQAGITINKDDLDPELSDHLPITKVIEEPFHISSNNVIPYLRKRTDLSKEEKERMIENFK